MNETEWGKKLDEHIAAVEKIREALQAKYPEQAVRIIPHGVVMRNLMREVEAGKVPGIKGFINNFFVDGIHATWKQKYLIGLTHYACLYQQAPKRLIVGDSAQKREPGLSPEQMAIFERIVWDTVANYQWSGIK